MLKLERLPKGYEAAKKAKVSKLFPDQTVCSYACHVRKWIKFNELEIKERRKMRRFLIFRDSGLR